MFWERPKSLRFAEHARAVEETAEELGRQIRAWLRREAVQAELVSEREHRADVIKREIRVALAKARRLPSPRTGFWSSSGTRTRSPISARTRRSSWPSAGRSWGWKWKMPSAPWRKG